MKYFKIFLIVSVAVFGVSCSTVKKYTPSFSDDGPPVSYHKWIVTAGEEKYMLTYKQIGEYIKGKLEARNDINNISEITGKIVDRKIIFQIYMQSRLTQEFEGVISQDGFKIRGTRTVDGRKGLEWTAENIDDPV